eukprot:7337216-Prymnesium_polylepis.1
MRILEKPPKRNHTINTTSMIRHSISAESCLSGCSSRRRRKLLRTSSSRPSSLVVWIHCRRPDELLQDELAVHCLLRLVHSVGIGHARHLERRAREVHDSEAATRRHAHLLELAWGHWWSHRGRHAKSLGKLWEALSV